MISICAIASGSNGNCYYIGNDREAVLIDAGISARQIMARMKQQNLDSSLIKAVFISHEHTDHTKGARVLSKKLSVPVFITSQTYRAMFPDQRPMSPRFFVPGNEIVIGELNIFTFSKRHDAAEPCSFRVLYKEFSIGVFTDIGSPCENVKYHLNQCQILFLETNYDEKMLWNGSYSWPLKKRIASQYGHLSNDQAYDLVVNHSGSGLKTILLSHLSAENNRPEVVLERFAELCNRYNICLTSRYEAGDVLKFEASKG